MKTKIGTILRIKMPDDYKSKEKTMTRDEAVDLVHVRNVNSADFVDALANLGLIKFDEPKKLYPHDIINAITDSSSPDPYLFLDNLKVNGYEIRKIKPLTFD